ncbi:hypothetical protein DFJ74DRAFT_758127 [Hyaloraphidium curvatum]|nr:hypothetical protein DFJ74DRAFT_758127 [Hyaloraphidium curvatum]
MPSQTPPPSPPGWPPELIFFPRTRGPPDLRRRLASDSVSAPIRASGSQLAKQALSSLRIRTIADPGHPACGQRGLFATKAFPPRTLLCEYAGDLCLSESPGSNYAVRLGSLCVDAARGGNAARFANDFRGVAGKPNAGFGEWTDADCGEVRMGLFALDRGIARGEEVLLSYGKSFWRERGLLRGAWEGYGEGGVGEVAEAGAGGSDRTS